jgi:16S rRNA (guanine527-N7)-methyltransferase
MDSARIAALLEPFLDRSLTAEQLIQISTYIDLLLRWNARINLTAIREPEEIVTRHFGESFFMARHLFPTPCHPERRQARSEASGSAESKDPYSSTKKDAEGAPSKLRLGGGVRVIDLGSGAGFPALPLKIWEPNIHLTLIESNHKKAAFLREVARALTFTNIDVIAERAETLPTRGAPEFLKPDIVTFRAVEKFERTLLLAASFLSPPGCLAVLISSAQAPQLTALTDLTWRTIPIPQSRTRILSIGEN